METQLVIRIDKGTKQKFSKIARTEGKTASAKIRELISSYVEENDFSRLVGDIWNRTTKKLKKEGYTIKDVHTAVRRVRASI